MRFSRTVQAIAFSLFICGVGLLTLNFYGVAVGPRPSVLSRVIPEPAPRGSFKKTTGESDVEYATRVMNLIYRTMSRSWPVRRSDLYNLRIPPYENFLLYLASCFFPSYLNYEFCDWRKGYERGVGQCSQMSMILVGVLRWQGIDAFVLPLDGHVVVDAELDGKRQILDPYFDVRIPFDINRVEKFPSIALPCYAKLSNEATKNKLLAIFAPPNFQPVSIKGYAGWRTLYFEKTSYILKWVLPMAMLATACLLRSAKKKRKSTI
ncbi:MAG: hypothetical protein GXP32_08575 [Kiritimatiellaeota bacterium]|nr:hypothetical protein [Kiritimatiellota bacterium]